MLIPETNMGVSVSRFKGKRIPITGGSSGMGLAGAQRIVTEGGHVAITGLNEERLERARSLLPAASIILKSDAANEADIHGLGEAINDWGSLDGLLLNGGFAEAGSPESVTADSFNRMMNVNVRGRCYSWQPSPNRSIQARPFW